MLADHEPNSWEHMNTASLITLREVVAEKMKENKPKMPTHVSCTLNFYNLPSKTQSAINPSWLHSTEPSQFLQLLYY